MKGQLITFISLKDRIILTIACLVILWLIFYVIPTIKSNIPASCPEGIIPDKLSNNIVMGYEYLTWKDGTKMFGPPMCRKGAKEGENVKYTYCTGLLYKNTTVYSNGTVGGTTQVLVDMVLDEQYNVVSHTCRIA